MKMRHPSWFTHDGFYLRISYSVVYLGLLGSDPESRSSHLEGLASGGAVAIGGTPWRGFVVGGEFSGTMVTNAPFTSPPLDDPSSGWNTSVGTVGAFVDWFPDVHGQWDLGALFGVSVVSVENPAIDTSWFGAGPTLKLFGGFNPWVGPEYSIGARVSLTATARVSLSDANDDSTGWSFVPISAMVETSILYH